MKVDCNSNYNFSAGSTEELDALENKLSQFLASNYWPNGNGKTFFKGTFVMENNANKKARLW